MISTTLTVFLALALASVSRAQSAIICGYDRIGEVSVTGSLKLFSNNQTAAPLPADGVNVTMQSTLGTGILYHGGDGGAGEFDFMSCDSTFMGYPSGQVAEGSGNDTIAYGQILSPTGLPLTVEYGSVSGPSTYDILNDWRSLSDDQSQLQQYWSLTNSSGVLTLDFLGVTANGTTYNGGELFVFRTGLGSEVNEVTPITQSTYAPESAPASLYTLRLIA